MLGNLLAVTIFLLAFILFRPPGRFFFLNAWQLGLKGGQSAPASCPGELIPLPSENPYSALSYHSFLICHENTSTDHQTCRNPPRGIDKNQYYPYDSPFCGSLIPQNWSRFSDRCSTSLPKSLFCALSALNVLKDSWSYHFHHPEVILKSS